MTDPIPFPENRRRKLEAEVNEALQKQALAELNHFCDQLASISVHLFEFEVPLPSGDQRDVVRGKVWFAAHVLHMVAGTLGSAAAALADEDYARDMIAMSNQPVEPPAARSANPGAAPRAVPTCVT